MIQRNRSTAASGSGSRSRDGDELEGGALDLVPSATAIDRRADGRRYELEYDPSADPPSQAVVAAVAAFTETDPAALEPLHAAVDTDALDALFRPPTDAGRRVAFRYGGLEITVGSPGTVTVTETTVETDG